jgi:hypothetical protein
MAVRSTHKISKDDYLILKLTDGLALSKIEYNCGKGQNLFPYIDSLPRMCHPVPTREQESSGSRHCACTTV